MFHKTLDQSSKRYKEHPNVAAIYTSLPRDKAKRPQQTSKQHQLSEIRDFAYDQQDSETNTRDFIANFTHFGFRSYHIRANNGDFLSKVGILSYAKKKHAAFSTRNTVHTNARDV